jgi:hypothetical protein
MGRIERVFSARGAGAWSIAFGVALLLPSLVLGFILDDFSHRLMLDRSFDFPGGQRAIWDLFRFQDSDRAKFHELLEAGVAPWWAPEDFRLAFFRPLTSLLHAVDYTFFPAKPMLMHAENLVLFAALAAVVAALYRRIVEVRWVAALATLMFAVDDAHALVVAWIANRNALLAAVFGFGALLAHADRRRFLAPILFALALLSGEVSVAALVYVVAYAMWLDDAPPRARVASLVPYACIAAAWLVVYRVIGYGAQGGGFYVDPVRQPLSYLSAIFERAPVLLLAQFAFPPSDFWFAVPERFVTPAALFVGSLVLAGASVVWKVVGHDRRARFFATGMLLSVLPLCATWPNDRLLLMVGFGAFGLVALFIAGVYELHGSLRRVAVPLAGFFVVVHVVLAPLLLPLREAQLGAFFRRPIQRGAATLLTLDDRSDATTYVIVNAPNALVPMFTAAEHVVETGGKGPTKSRLLGVTVSGTLGVERVDERTLALEFSDGFPQEPLSRFFRDPKMPFTPGQEIRIEGFLVRIESCDAYGNATRVTFQFDVPLEDPSLSWIVWEKTGFVRYRPPSIGERETRPPIALMDISQAD